MSTDGPNDKVSPELPITYGGLAKMMKEFEDTKRILGSVQADASLYAEQNRALKVIAKRALHFIQDIQAGKEEDVAKSRSKLGGAILAFQNKYQLSFEEVQEAEDGT